MKINANCGWMGGVILVTYLLSVHDAHCQRVVVNQTPLTEAVLSGDAGRVRLLLAEGADINATNRAGFTALMLAARNVQDQIVDILLAEGADANLEIPVYRWTALRQAASDGNPKIIKSLLKAGARLDAKDRNGWTPVVAAAMAGKAENLKALSDAGAQLKMDLVFASALGQLDQVKTLSGATDINATNDTGRTPLAAAAANNQVEVVKFLLSKGANPDSEGASGSVTTTALTLAVVEGHLGMVKILAEKGADLNKKTSGWTPLLNAIDHHNQEMVQFLLEKKVDPNQTTPGGMPALFFAATERQAAIMKLLIEAGADINATAKKGWTALMVSASSGDELGTATLLSAGAKVGLKNNDLNETALQIAQHNGFESVVELFRNPDAARARAAQPAAPETKEPLDSITMTMADFKKAVTPFNANSLGFKGRLLTEQGFKKQFGQPFETQKFGEQAMWYYKCSDGLIQLVIEAAFLQQQGVVIKDINEQSLPDGPRPADASAGRSSSSSDAGQTRPGPKPGVAQNPTPEPQITTGEAAPQIASTSTRQSQEQSITAPASTKDTASAAIPLANTGKAEAPSPQPQEQARGTRPSSEIIAMQRQVDEMLADSGTPGASQLNPALWHAAGGPLDVLTGVKVVLELGAEVNSADPDGNTALILAAQKGHSQVAKYLLTKGADVGKTNRLGQTAMDVAKDEEMRTVLKEAPKKN